jgi:glycosyltransferase involved in cell wall biosynthesis
MGKKDILYVLHKNGANSHYYGLAHLAEQQDMVLKYREFSVFSKFYKGLIRGNFPLVKKQLVNAGFLLGLLFSSQKKVVLGIAPFDAKLKYLLFFLKRHKIYYHTSWTCWDKTFHPKNKKNTQKVFTTWKHFIEKKSEHIFTVTQISKEGIAANYNVPPEKISVVQHSLHPIFNTHEDNSRIPKSFMYVGRLTQDKGIDELLDFAINNPSATLTLIGDGKKKEKIIEHSKAHTNILYKEFITNKGALKGEFAKHQFLLLNSKRTTSWEELFGLILIEAMSQGTIPIAPKHSGPKEIIATDFGHLFEEGEITPTLAKILSEVSFTEEKSQKAILASQQYHVSEISKKWKPILV